MDGGGEARIGIAKFKATTVPARDGFDEGQAEPEAGSGATCIQPLEPPQSALTILRGDPWPIVVYAQAHASSVLLEADCDTSAVRRVADRILDQVAQRLGEQGP